MLIYISGFHEAIEDDRLIRQQFDQVQLRYCQLGYEVINPASKVYRESQKQASVQMNVVGDLTITKKVTYCRATRILQGLASIIVADKVLFLSNGTFSEQARIEREFCNAIAKDFEIIP